jgi:hypothetical protein
MPACPPAERCAEPRGTCTRRLADARDADLDDEERRFALAAELRGVDKELFPIPPNEILRAPLDRELQLVSDQLAKLAAMPADDALRTVWEPVLRAAHGAVVAAKASKGSEQSDLAVIRTRIASKKAAFDAFRVELHGKILQIVKDKSRADAFFRAAAARARKSTGPVAPP